LKNLFKKNKKTVCELHWDSLKETDYDKYYSVLYALGDKAGLTEKFRQIDLFESKLVKESFEEMCGVPPKKRKSKSVDVVEEVKVKKEPLYNLKEPYSGPHDVKSYTPYIKALIGK